MARYYTQLECGCLISCDGGGGLIPVCHGFNASICKVPEYQKEQRIRYNKDIAYHLHTLIRLRIIHGVKRLSKKSSTFELLGCSIRYLRTWLENNFKKGMTWQNWGRKGWHIDHIKPCCSFDLSKKSEQKKCFHYSNLQPLWWYENLAKKDKIYV